MIRHAARTRARAAAARAPRVLPGPVGEMIARELTAWADTVECIGGHGMLLRLADDVLRRPLPAAEAVDAGT